MDIFDLERKYKIEDKITDKRIKTIIPKMMKKASIDMWLILASEYNEDPVFNSLVPGIITNASRLTCLAFYLDEKGDLEAVSINKPNRALGKFYKQLPYSADGQWEGIKSYVIDKNPNKIGVNISDTSALAAGLSHSLYTQLVENLGIDLSGKIVSADEIAIGYLQELIKDEVAMYPSVYALTTEVMSRAFSREVITPGITTTEDVEYWIANEFRKQGLPTCFPPTINLQRQGKDNSMITGIIQPGDLLHYDAGIEFLGLCTDLQRLGYILGPQETDAPIGIKKAFNIGREFGYMAEKEFKAGLTGNEVFKNIKYKAKENGLEATLYTHPIGKHCHGAGPTIGLYDKQEHIPGEGDRKLQHNTAFALEYNVLTYVEEWDQNVFMYLEETVLFLEDGKLRYLDNKYTDLILI